MTPVNLLDNPGFEDPSSTAWQMTNAKIVDSKDADWVTPHTGEKMLRISVGGQVVQTVEARKGAAYTLAFYSNHYDARRINVDYSTDGSTWLNIAAGLAGDGQNWVRHELALPSMDSDTQLSIRLRVPNSDIRVDDVSLIETQS